MEVIMIKNPVLTGFHPDPSMICVDGTFYIANSTFEYFPGVRISASKDLANWECVSTPLSETRFLDMAGNVVSGGIWAPCLSYCDGIFYLVYTDVKSWKVYPFKDAHNYIVTARNIEGPWTEPVYMNSIGFDTSLFHDDDGRKYFLNAEWDFRRPDEDTFSGILLTEVDPVTLEFIGETKKIFTGTDRGLTEGPHIYKKDGWYYVLVAEGGTFYEHTATVARSRDIFGPYEVHPNKHICSAMGHPEHPIQKTGHTSWCQGPDGRWFFAFLCGRPVDGTNCILGRETGINELIWKNDWPYLKNETLLVDEFFEGYGEKIEKKYVEYTFGDKEFYLNFNTLRAPSIHLLGAGNTLRLYGAESLFSNQDQAMFVRRQTDFDFEATTCVTLPFEQFQQFAGLIYRYDEQHQYLLKIAYDERVDRHTLSIMAVKDGVYTAPLSGSEIPLASDTAWLRVTGHGAAAAFSYSVDGKNFMELDYVIDAAMLSDDHIFGFTGAYVGMAAYDLYDHTSYADFTHFSYRAL
jgi:xylan 1,4-beta-xylosidase